MAGKADVEDVIRDFVRELKLQGAIRSRAVERAFHTVERHKLLESFYVWPEELPRDLSAGDFLERHLDPNDPDPRLLQQIYSDDAIVTKLDEDGRPTSSTSQPSLVAAMLEELELSPGLSVLEIGTGTGYNAALMAEIVGDPARITSIDVQPEVVRQARILLDQASYGGIRVLSRDGAHGAPQGAPYDRVIATVGCPDISWAWAEQLAGDGLMLIPVQHGGPHCDPLIKLTPVGGDARHLRGRVADWSGFMGIHGKLSSQTPWASIDDSEPLIEGRPPDREYPLFPALQHRGGGAAAPRDGVQSWYDFHYFLALCDWRTVLGFDRIALVDTRQASVIALTPRGIQLWGDESLYQDLERIYTQWEALEKPRLTEWSVEFFPRGEAPDPDDEELWVIDRAFSRQLVYLAST